MVKAAESTSDEESGAVEELIDRLVAQFPEARPDTVRDIVNASWAEFTGRPIRTFVPVLVERTARQHLRHTAAAWAANPQEAVPGSGDRPEVHENVRAPAVGG